MPAAPRSAGTQTKSCPKGCPEAARAPPAPPGLARRGRAAGEPRLLARCWKLATRAWPSAHQPCALPARPPVPTGAGARGARGGRGRCHARCAPGSQWAGRENAGSTRGPRVPAARAVNHASVTRPAPPRLPRPAVREGGPRRCCVTVPLAATVPAAATALGSALRAPPPRPRCEGLAALERLP